MIRRWMPAITGAAIVAVAACVAAPSAEGPMTRAEVEVVILGIAQDGGVPQIGDLCSNCEAARRDSARRHTVAALGLIDRRSGKAYVIDATPDFPEQWDLLREGMERPSGASRVAPDGIFLTHGHIGHYLGLAYLGREAFGARGTAVYGTSRMVRFLTDNAPWELLVRLGNISLIEVVPGEPIRLREGLSVTPIRSPHRQEYTDAVGYLIEARRSLLYIPDTDGWEGWETPIEELCGQVDYALLDGTFYSSSELPGRDISTIPHPLVTDTAKRLEAIAGSRPGRVFFTHLNHSNPLLDPCGEARESLEALGFRVAAEGMRLSL